MTRGEAVNTVLLLAIIALLLFNMRREPVQRFVPDTEMGAAFALDTKTGRTCYTLDRSHPDNIPSCSTLK